MPIAMVFILIHNIINNLTFLGTVYKVQCLKKKKEIVIILRAPPPSPLKGISRNIENFI